MVGRVGEESKEDGAGSVVGIGKRICAVCGQRTDAWTEAEDGAIYCLNCCQELEIDL